MLSTRSFFHTALLSFTALALLSVTAPGLNAHDDSMSGNGQVPPHARDTMRAFAREHHHDENLTAMSITSCVGGMAGVYPCSNVDLMAFLPLSQIGGGKYTIQNVSAGLQTVTASKDGYDDLEQDVNVAAGGTVTLNFTLIPQ
jgi:hypothetical protein